MSSIVRRRRTITVRTGAAIIQKLMLVKIVSTVHLNTAQTMHAKFRIHRRRIEQLDNPVFISRPHYYFAIVQVGQEVPT